MKNLLRSLFSPILTPFERGNEDFNYKPLNRKVLIAVGILFLILILTISIVILVPSNLSGAFIPISVFGIASLVCLVVGFLGTNRAIAKIWGNK